MRFLFKFIIYNIVMVGILWYNVVWSYMGLNGLNYSTLWNR